VASFISGCEHSPSCAALLAQMWNRSWLQFIFNKSHPLGFELETFGSDTMLNYYAPTNYTQKPKLMGKGGQFILYFNTRLLVKVTCSRFLASLTCALQDSMYLLHIVIDFSISWCLRHQFHLGWFILQELFQVGFIFGSFIYVIN
jgi:hypothetical protein